MLFEHDLKYPGHFGHGEYHGRHCYHCASNKLELSSQNVEFWRENHNEDYREFQDAQNNLVQSMDALCAAQNNFDSRVEDFLEMRNNLDLGSDNLQEALIARAEAEMDFTSIADIHNND